MSIFKINCGRSDQLVSERALIINCYFKPPIFGELCIKIKDSEKLWIESAFHKLIVLIMSLNILSLLIILAIATHYHRKWIGCTQGAHPCHPTLQVNDLASSCKILCRYQINPNLVTLNISRQYLKKFRLHNIEWIQLSYFINNLIDSIPSIFWCTLLLLVIFVWFLLFFLLLFFILI